VDREQVEGGAGRIARVLVQRDWDDDNAGLATAARVIWLRFHAISRTCSTFPAPGTIPAGRIGPFADDDAHLVAKSQHQVRMVS
jgi:hypothetical protein